MKNFLISAIVACFLCDAAYAGMQPTTPVVINNISILSTNQTAVTNTVNMYGHIEVVFVGITNAFAAATQSVTVAVDVGDDMGIWRTVYSNSSISASTPAYVSVAEQTVAGAAAGTNVTRRIPVYSDKLRVTGYNNGTAGTTVKIWALISLP